MGIDPTKVQIVQSCLDAAFKDVRPDKLNERFVFNDGNHSCELEFDRSFIDDVHTGRLKKYMETNVVPALKANPGKKIYVSTVGAKIGNKDSN